MVIIDNLSHNNAMCQISFRHIALFYCCGLQAQTGGFCLFGIIFPTDIVVIDHQFAHAPIDGDALTVDKRILLVAEEKDSSGNV